MLLNILLAERGSIVVYSSIEYSAADRQDLSNVPLRSLENHR